jgi:nucleotide-binding universal stress UspA family protein
VEQQTSIVVVLNEARDQARLAARAIEYAKKTDAELIVLTVIDPQVLGKAALRLTDQGQVGALPSRGLVDCVSLRHEQLAREEAAEIIDRAHRQAVRARSSVQHGDYATKASEVIRSELPAAVFVERRPLSRLRLRRKASFLERLSEEAGFELVEV